MSQKKTHRAGVALVAVAALNGRGRVLRRRRLDVRDHRRNAHLPERARLDGAQGQKRD
jgi:hypothetical protein